MNVVNNEDLKRLDQLAGYLAHGISPRDAGAAVGFSPGRVSALLQSEDFQTLVGAKKQSLLQGYVDTNKTYDEIEKIATMNLLTVLKMNQDPDLALKAMAISNKAIRRGTNNGIHAPEPIEPGKDGARVNISLSFNMIQKVQSGRLDTEEIKVEASHAEHNTATPQILAQLMGMMKGGINQAIAAPSGAKGLMNFASPMDIGDAEARVGRPRKEPIDI